MAIVTHVLGDCPGCGGKNTYGNVMIPGGQHVLLGCGRCEYKAKRFLPDIRKKIVYLDQFLLSKAFRGGDERCVRTVERVSRTCSLQLLVAPFSSVHEEETHQWSGREQLMRFIKDTSRGSEFRSSDEVEQRQIAKGFEAFLKGDSSQFVPDERVAIRGDIHQWDDYYRIEVRRYLGDIEEIRRLKAEAVQMLVDVFDDWQVSTNSFEDDVALEVAASGRNYLEAYIQFVTRVGKGDYGAFWDGPVSSLVVENLIHCLPSDTPLGVALARIRDYFESQHFAQLPCEWLSTRMFATLKGMVKRGAYANREAAVDRLSGVFYDVKHISTYAPYCDAFFMDQAMADLVQQPGVGLEQRFGTQVYSLNNLDEFLAWLDSLEASMPSAHTQGLRTAYPHLG